MQKITKIYLVLSLAFLGINEAVAGISPVEVPEMDTSIAALGLCLAAGVVTLISEHRRK